jgi:hypothetical protein
VVVVQVVHAARHQQVRQGVVYPGQRGAGAGARAPLSLLLLLLLLLLQCCGLHPITAAASPADILLLVWVLRRVVRELVWVLPLS